MLGADGLGDEALVEQLPQAGVERAVGQGTEDTERSVEALAQLVAVHGALVQQPQDGELEQFGATAHDGCTSLRDRHTDWSVVVFVVVPEGSTTAEAYTRYIGPIYL